LKFLSYRRYDFLCEELESVDFELLYFGEFNYKYMFPYDDMKDELPTLFINSYLELLSEKLFKKHKILKKTTK